MHSSLREQFGDIDIYLFDQLLRGRIRPGMRVFDSGCGHGRNLVYLLRTGYDVCGSDADPASVARGPCASYTVASMPARWSAIAVTGPQIPPPMTIACMGNASACQCRGYN